MIAVGMISASQPEDNTITTTTDNSPILLIFDIDGTIGNTGGVGKTAFEQTFCEQYGITKSAEGIRPFGKTDQLIFEELLINNSVPYEDFDTEFKIFSKKFITNFEILFTKSNKPFIYDGVKILIERLSKIAKIYLALGTGNLKENAYIHLRKYNLDRFLPTGGFSNTIKARPQLIKKAYQNAIDYYQLKFTPDNTWIIGDTPNDIAAGKANGFRTIAVATGPFTSAELIQYKPDEIMDDLTEHEKFLSIVLKEKLN